MTDTSLMHLGQWSKWELSALPKLHNMSEHGPLHMWSRAFCTNSEYSTNKQQYLMLSVKYKNLHFWNAEIISTQYFLKPKLYDMCIFFFLYRSTFLNLFVFGIHHVFLTSSACFCSNTALFNKRESSLISMPCQVIFVQARPCPQAVLIVDYTQAKY